MICSTQQESTLATNNIADLCRICSAPGSHSLFLKIPPYLHEKPQDSANWPTEIHRLVTEVTGLEITPDDGLPQKICVICISYLKHAYTFRRQTINNVAALLAAKFLIGEQELRKDTKEEEVEVIPTMENPAVVRANVNEISCKMMELGGKQRKARKTFFKEVLHQVLGGSIQQKKKQNNAEEERKRIDEALISRCPNWSPEADATRRTGEFFTYTEKEFQEDDVMELEVLKECDITFNLPKNYKEKKCPSCCRRFMCEESYNEHLKKCLMLKLVKFIREVQNFQFLLSTRLISSFEFIRRIVFSVKQMVEVISSYGEDTIETELETAESAKTADEDAVKSEQSFLSNLEELRLSYNTEGPKPLSPTVLYRPDDPTDDGRSSFTTGSTSISSLTAITRCEECHVTFETVTELEAHNLLYHRGFPVVTAMPNNLRTPPAQFPPPPTPPTLKEMERIKNRLLSQTPPDSSPSASTAGPSSSDDQRKTVSCKKCHQRFYTITQLDNHQIRSCRQRSPGPSKATPERSNRKNLNANYFYEMEMLKDKK